MFLSVSLVAKELELDLSIKHRANSITTHSMTNHLTKMGEPIVVNKNNLEAVFSAVEKNIRAYGKNSRSAILYEGKIYKVVDGERKLIASPQVIGPIDDEVTFSTEDDNGDRLTVSLNAKSLID